MAGEFACRGCRTSGNFEGVYLRRHAAPVFVGTCETLAPCRDNAASIAARVQTRLPCGKRLIEDWYQHGRVTRLYPLPCYTDALGRIPLDIDYSNARSDIEFALHWARRGRVVVLRSPAATIAGVSVITIGSPSKPASPGACIERWNAPANVSARRNAQQRTPHARRAIVTAASASGYFREVAGRCLISLISDGTRPSAETAAVFVEKSYGQFAFTADAAGRFTRTNATLGRGDHLHVR